MTAYRRWRMFFPGSNAGGDLILVDVELRSVPGGADLTSPAQALARASGSAPRYTSFEGPEKAFDNDAGTFYQPSGNASLDEEGAYTGGIFLDWDFGDGNAVQLEEIQLTAHPSYLNRTPYEIHVLGSDDGVAWTTDWSILKPGGWATAVRVFNRAEIKQGASVYQQSTEIGYEPAEAAARLSALQEETLYQVQPTVTRLSAEQNEILYQPLPTETYLYALQLEILQPLEQGTEVPPPVVIAPTPKRRRMIVGLSRILDLVADPPPPVVLPDAQTDLTGEAISTSAVQLAFANVPEAVSYEYRVEGGDALPLAQNKIVGGLPSNTELDFEVRPVLLSGDRGHWSNVTTEKTWEEVRPDVPVIPVEPAGEIKLYPGLFTGSAPAITFKPDGKVKITGYYRDAPGNFTETDYQYMSGGWVPSNWQIMLTRTDGAGAGALAGPAPEVWHDLANEITWSTESGAPGFKLNFRRKSDNAMLHESIDWRLRRLAESGGPIGGAAFQIEDAIIAGMWTANIRFGANGILYHHTAPGPATPIGPYIADVNQLSLYEIRVDADFVHRWEVNSGVGQWLAMGPNLFWGWDKTGASYVAPAQSNLTLQIRRKADGVVVKTVSIMLELYGNA